MIKMIERLVDTGYAYVVDGHVLFDTTKYPQGVLTGQTEGRDHARIDEASYKRNQSDFVLWKPADGEVGWDSPWGPGRPGRSEEDPSALRSLMRRSSAVCCLKKNK